MYLVANRRYPPFLLATKEVYETRVRGIISKCVHVQDIRVLQPLRNRSYFAHTQWVIKDLVENENTVLCIWTDVNPVSTHIRSPFEKIAEFFGIWHEFRRGKAYAIDELFAM